MRIVPLMMLLLSTSASADIDGRSISGGEAIGDLWSASAVEYQASAEAMLERLGARNIQRPDLVDSMMADFLRTFSGGGGAPLDLVEPRVDAFGAEELTLDQL
jgi:hypothetical protein